MGIADRTSFGPDQRLDNVYALWRFCQATGDVAPLRQRWSDIRTLAIRAVQTLDWASAGHFCAGTANRGSAEAANRRFARWVVLANAATTLDDPPIRKLACAAALKIQLLCYERRAKTSDPPAMIVLDGNYHGTDMITQRLRGMWESFCSWPTSPAAGRWSFTAISGLPSALAARGRRQWSGRQYVNRTNRDFFFNKRREAPEVEATYTLYMYEAIKAIKDTCEELGLGRHAVEAIFHGNAERLIAGVVKAKAPRTSDNCDNQDQ